MPQRTFKVLDVSTANLPQEVCDRLPTYEGVIARPNGEYGWWLHVPPDADPAFELGEDVPDVIRNLMAYARQHDCEWVLIDRDATVEPDLPSWSW